MSGTYILKSNENYEAFLGAIGVPAELAGKMALAKPVLEVTDKPDGLDITTTAGDKSFTNTIVYGQDSTTNVAGINYVINVSKTPTGYSGTVKLGGKTGTACLEMTADGFVQTASVGGVTCKRVYSKQ